MPNITRRSPMSRLVEIHYKLNLEHKPRKLTAEVGVSKSSSTSMVCRQKIPSIFLHPESSKSKNLITRK
jgi:hypothetical protein